MATDDRTKGTWSGRDEPFASDYLRTPSGSPVQLQGDQDGATPSGPKSILDTSPVLALPKGGGAIRGIGEKFAVDPATGSASFSVPLPLSPSRSGATPELSLTYDSGAGAGIFGWGWRLTLPVISRRTDRGLPRYLDDDQPDTFMLSEFEDLVPLFQEDGAPQITPDPAYLVRRYAPRSEGAFARIEQWVHRANRDTHWRVISSANVTTIFGPTEASRIIDPESGSRIFAWLAAEIFDDKGNRTVFEYKPEDSEGIPTTAAHEACRAGRPNPQRHLKRIKYGNVRPRGMPGDDRFLFELVLDYGEHARAQPGRAETSERPARLDPISTRRAGFEMRTYRLCERALMFHRLPGGSDEDAKLVRALAFNYRRSPAASLMIGVQPFGHRPAPALLLDANSARYRGALTLPKSGRWFSFAPNVLNACNSHCATPPGRAGKYRRW